MQITTRLPESDPHLDAALTRDGWKRVRDPGTLAAIMLASLPFRAANAAATIAVASLFAPLDPTHYGFSQGSFALLVSLPALAGVAGLLVLHECLHLVCIPRFLRSEKTYAGITWVGGFVATGEVLGRNRFIAVSIAPFLVISLGLPFVLGSIGWLHPFSIALVLLNALASSVASLTAVLALSQVPADACIVSSGMTTYWRQGSSA
ncbi:MAG: DUF3267 domain-containing protein [Methanobacteriota archaeon]|nr:MAG: DUF3267 domain-containing protein [Euryarchaeota archaeon]